MCPCSRGVGRRAFTRVGPKKVCSMKISRVSHMHGLLEVHTTPAASKM